MFCSIIYPDYLFELVYLFCNLVIVYNDICGVTFDILREFNSKRQCDFCFVYANAKSELNKQVDTHKMLYFTQCSIHLVCCKT